MFALWRMARTIGLAPFTREWAKRTGYDREAICRRRRRGYSDTKPAKESSCMITIEEFGKIELRVATIKAVEPHPNADRLFVLKIDLGTEERQLVAGIRAHYAPEELVGKQI